MSDSPLRHVTLVDGSGFIFRAFHGLPMMTRPDGVPVNAVYGFASMLMKLMQESTSDHLAVIFDAGRTTFRSEIYPAYKAHRPEPPEELVPQFALIRDAVRAFNVPCVELAGFEADDLIATYARLAREQGARVTIVSSDKDLMQLVGEGVEMFDPLKNRVIGPAEVFEKFAVAPDKVVDVQALAGDSTDNVPGVPGIGIKTAAQLITEYGDLESLLARAAEIKQPKRRESLIENADLARVSRRLVELRQDVPVPESLDNFALRQPDRIELLAFIDAQGFRSIRARIEQHLNANGASASSEAAPAAEVAKIKTDYELVLTVEALERWVAAARSVGVVAVDTETNSLDSLRCDLVGVSLSVAPGKACYIPVLHSDGPAQGDLLGGGGPSGPAILPKAVTLEILKPLLEDPGVLKVGHNIKFDLQVLSQVGIEVDPIDDTMLLSYVLTCGLHGQGMDELSSRYLSHETIPFSQVCGTGKAQITFDRVSLDKALAYAAEDADITLRLHSYFKPRLLAEHMVTVYETLERPLVQVLSRMERHGIKVDKAELQAMSLEFGQRMTTLEREICELAGMEFNVGSPKQLGEVLFDKLQLPGGKKGKTGAYATGADILEQLAGAASAAAEGAGLASDRQAEEHLCRRAGRADQSRHGPGSYQLFHGRHQHRALGLVGPESAEYPDPHRGGTAHPPRLHRRAGQSVALGRLFADRAAACRPCRRHRGAEAGLPRRRRHSCHHRLAGLRRAGRRHGPDDPPQGQGHQFRHHLRHQRLRPGPVSWIFPTARPRATSTPISPATRKSAATWSGPRKRRGPMASSPPCSAANASPRALPRRTRPCGPSPSGPLSMRRSRAAPPTSSSGP